MLNANLLPGKVASLSGDVADPATIGIQPRVSIRSLMNDEGKA